MYPNPGHTLCVSSVLNKSGVTGSPPGLPTFSTGSPEGELGAHNQSIYNQYFHRRMFCRLCGLNITLAVIFIDDGGLGGSPPEKF